MENVGRETFPSRVAYLSSAGPLRNPKLITPLASKPGSGSRFPERFENKGPSCFGSFQRPYLVDTAARRSTLHSSDACGRQFSISPKQKCRDGRPAARICAAGHRLPGRSRSECERQALIHRRLPIFCEPLLPKWSSTLSNVKQSRDGSVPSPKTISGKSGIPSDRSVWTRAGASPAPVRNSP
jgi:hypothetical protein